MAQSITGFMIKKGSSQHGFHVWEMLSRLSGLSMTMVGKLLLLLYMFIAHVNVVHAQGHIPDPQSWHTSRDGLSHDRILSIGQDSAGFLLIGTVEGLDYFDGNEFHAIFNDRLIPKGWEGSFEVEDIAVDSSGKVWFIGGGHLFVFERSTGLAQRIREIDHAGDLGRRILYDKSHNGLWLFLDQKLSLFDTDSRKLSPTPFDPHYEYVNAMQLDGNGNLWIGYKNSRIIERLDYLDIDRGQRKIFPEIGWSLAYDAVDDLMWIGTWANGLWLYDLKKQTLINKSGHGEFNAQQLITLDIAVRHNMSHTEYPILIASSDQFWYDPVGEKLDRNIYLEQEDGDPYGRVERSFVDRDGIIWLGAENGLVRIGRRSSYFEQYKPKFLATPYQNAIIHFQSDPIDSRYRWIGTWGGGIFKYDKHTHEVKESFLLPIQRPSGFMDATESFIHAMRIHDDRWVYLISEKNGLMGISPQGKLQDFSAHPIHGIRYYGLEQGDDSTYWVSSHGALYRFDATTRTLSDKAYLIPDSAFTRRMVRDKLQPMMWVASDNGLYNFHTETSRFQKAFPVQGNMIVYDIAQHDDGTIWIDTEKGLFCRRTGDKDFVSQGKLFGRHSRMAHVMNMVKYMTFDGDDLWIYSNVGLYCLNHQTGAVRLFTQNDGLKYRHPYYFMNYAKVDGQLYLLQFAGYTTVNKQPNQRLQSPPVYTLYYSTNKKPWELINSGLKNIVLGKEEQSITIKYTTVDLDHSSSPQFRYRLIGISNEWAEAGANQREVTYASLKPYINYIFEVQAKSNGSSEWSETSTLSITVQPKLYQTWWFRLGALILILYFCYLLIRQRIRKIRTSEKQKAKAQRRFLELKMNAVRAQMNPHFIFNCLNSIKLYALENDSVSVSNHLTDFSRLIRLVLHHSKENMVSLESELEAVSLYLAMEKMRFKDKLRYEVKVDDHIDIEFIQVPPMLVQPYVENAVWHGLMNRKNGGNILLRIIELDNTHIMILIRDDGVGRQKAMQFKSKSATKDKSYGMSMTKDRIDMVNQYYAQHITVDVHDLTDQTGNAMGTEVRIVIKVNE